MAAGRKKKRNGYAIFMCVYIVIVLVLVGVGLTWLWGYAVAYEDSQPTNTMDKVVEELNKSFWNDDMAATIAAMPHEAQTDEECAEIIKSMIGSGVSYKRSWQHRHHRYIQSLSVTQAFSAA